MPRSYRLYEGLDKTRVILPEGVFWKKTHAYSFSGLSRWNMLRRFASICIQGCFSGIEDALVLTLFSDRANDPEYRGYISISQADHSDVAQYNA